MPRFLEPVWKLVRDAAYEWIAHRARRKGVALASYTSFSVAPMLIIVIAIADFFLRRSHSRRHYSTNFWTHRT